MKNTPGADTTADTIAIIPVDNTDVDSLVTIAQALYEYNRSVPALTAEELEAAHQETQQVQAKLDTAIVGLSSVDFGDYESILMWICDFEALARHEGVIYDSENILSIFRKHGFTPYDMETPTEFVDESDREALAKHIIEQSLSYIQSMEAFGIIHIFVPQWVEKFGRQAQADAAKIETLRDEFTD